MDDEDYDRPEGPEQEDVKVCAVHRLRRPCGAVALIAVQAITSQQALV